MLTAPRLDQTADPDRFLVKSPREIAALLRALEKDRVLVRMHVPDQPLSVITTLLEVDEHANTVVVDSAPESNMNWRLVRAGYVQFDAMLNKVRVVFSISKIVLCTHEGRPALKFAFPAELKRLQRRDYYRVEVPLSQPTLCTFPLRHGNQAASATLPLEDISCGGMLVVDNSGVLDSTVGKLYAGCRLDLPETGSLTVTAQVMREVNDTLSNDKKVHRVGLAFIGLPNAASITLQRHIGQIERKDGARRRGFE